MKDKGTGMTQAMAARQINLQRFLSKRALVGLGLAGVTLLSACQEQTAQQQTEQIPSEPDLALTGLLIPGPNGATLYRCDNGQTLVSRLEYEDQNGDGEVLSVYPYPVKERSQVLWCCRAAIHRSRWAAVRLQTVGFFQLGDH